MNRIIAYLKRMGIKRMLFVLLGNAAAGLGIGLLRKAGLGFDPFCAMNLEVSEYTFLSYGTFQLLLNLALFAVQLAFGRKTIGFGTIINACLLGYFNSFFLYLINMLLPGALPLPYSLLMTAAAVIILSLGLSLYQTPGAGTAPYDAMPFILERCLPKLPYFLRRMLLDVSCTVICIIAGGIAGGSLGIGTVICAFCLGPVIRFFDRAFTEKHITAM